MSSNLPISEVIKRRTEQDEHEDESLPKRSRQENYKKAKELEEARKAGEVPAAVDEHGKDINPHIPQYISSVPFFYNTAHPTLKHQRSNKQDKQGVPLDAIIPRGLKIQTATKYRPGACENCGSMTHKRKDCLERPRKVGAKFTNKNIAPDEIIMPEIEHTYDSKRDRWAGFTPDMYKKTVQEYEKVEESKRILKEEKLKSEADAASKRAEQDKAARERGDVNITNFSDDDDDTDEDERYAEKADMPGTKLDSKHRITVRNLRIREDTAKYLHNLDPNSAYYDPKTRSMRDNPIPEASGSKSAGTSFTGENFIRYTGDVNQVNKSTLFAWQAAEKGVDIHLQAMPTKTEIVQRKFEVMKDEKKEKITEFLTHHYGDPAEQAKPAKDLQLSQSESYVEYNRKFK